MTIDTTPDVLAKSRILRDGNIVKRVIFDPTNVDHLKSLNKFLTEARWGDVQFYPEEPHVTVPETVIYKMARHAVEQQLASWVHA